MEGRGEINQPIRYARTGKSNPVGLPWRHAWKTMIERLCHHVIDNVSGSRQPRTAGLSKALNAACIHLRETKTHKHRHELFPEDFCFCKAVGKQTNKHTYI